MTTVLWDADYLVYGAGFAVEHKHYIVTRADAPDTVYGLYEDAEGKNKAVEAIETAGGTPLTYTRHFLEDFALERAQRNAASMISSTLDRLGMSRKDCAFYLTGKRNFRDAIATLRPYKGNRDKSSRPLLYREVREFLMAEYAAVVIEDKEADDEIAYQAAWHRDNRRPHVILHVDKDLYQIPGLHYVPGKGYKEVSEAWGKTFFYRQVLTGDTVDNIPGVYRLGAKRAKELLPKPLPPEDMWRICLDQYLAAAKRYGPEKVGYDATQEAAFEAAVENARLLYLLEWPQHDLMWNPPEIISYG